MGQLVSELEDMYRNIITGGWFSIFYGGVVSSIPVVYLVWFTAHSSQQCEWSRSPSTIGFWRHYTLATSARNNHCRQPQGLAVAKVLPISGLGAPRHQQVYLTPPCVFDNTEVWFYILHCCSATTTPPLLLLFGAFEHAQNNRNNRFNIPRYQS